MQSKGRFTILDVATGTLKNLKALTECRVVTVIGTKVYDSKQASNSLTNPPPPPPTKYRLLAPKQRQCNICMASAHLSHLHVCLLAATGPSGAFPVTQHTPHALHLRRGQTFVELGLPCMLMLMITVIPLAVFQP